MTCWCATSSSSFEAAPPSSPLVSATTASLDTAARASAMAHPGPKLAVGGSHRTRPNTKTSAEMYPPLGHAAKPASALWAVATERDRTLRLRPKCTHRSAVRPAGGPAGAGWLGRMAARANDSCET
eukprot:scaffold119303_cov51-Phaeocystis_antarctica.AAC.5